MVVESIAKSHRGLVRKDNEDAVLELPNHQVWVVADGMGGLSDGHYASQTVVTHVAKRLEQDTGNHSTVELVVQALQAANEDLYHYGVEELSGKRIGSTAVALVIDEDDYHFIWAGDSRGYLFREGALVQQTRDHSRANQLLDGGSITSIQAASHPLKHEVARAIGVSRHVAIEVVQGRLKSNDTFLLCSDGLHDALSDFEIEGALIDATIDASVEKLVHSVLVRGARDNVSCVLAKFTR
ncbi:PP2C family protein-serine/threonine phosphatase [Pseudoalteromonas pernae]|uniref:PP2C family protein-serine/threonine phosphatase n=1 Tax=Pseudoalteromonas pernae TaxID=3118054 RepID=UPI00324220B6